MVNDFYQGLPSNYANYEDIVLPKHESMREKTRREGVYDYYDRWNKDAYTWIDKFLEDSVGKKFDNVYPKVCERFRKKKTLNFVTNLNQELIPIICLMYLGIVSCDLLRINYLCGRITNKLAGGLHLLSNVSSFIQIKKKQTILHSLVHKNPISIKYLAMSDSTN